MILTCLFLSQIVFLTVDYRLDCALSPLTDEFMIIDYTPITRCVCGVHGDRKLAPPPAEEFPISLTFWTSLHSRCF